MGAGDGFLLAGAYVELGIEMAPLRAAVAETESLLTTLVAKEFVLRPTIDLAQAREAVAQLAADISRAMSGFTPGSGAAAMGSLQQQFAAVSGITAVGPMAQPIFSGAGALALRPSSNDAEIEAASDHAVATAEKVSERTEEKLRTRGVGQAGGRGGVGRSPLSAYGLASRLGVGIGAVIAVEEAVNVGAGLIEAGRIASSPERVLRQYDQPFDPFVLSATAAGQLEGRALAQIHGQQKAIGTMEAIPLLGHVVRLGDAIAGTSDSLSDQAFGAERTMVVERGLLQSHAQDQMRMASATGDEADRLRQQRDAELAPLRLLAAQIPSLATRIAAAQTADASNYGVQSQHMAATVRTIEQINPELAGEFQVAIQARNNIADKERSYNLDIGNAERAAQSGLNAQYGAGVSAQLRGHALDLLSARGVDSERRAMQISQRAEFQDFAVRAAGDFDQAKKPQEQDAATAKTIGARAELEAKQGKERVDLQRSIDRQIADAAAEGDEAVLRAHGQAYAADLAAFNRYADQKREDVKGKSAEQIYAAEAEIAKRSEAITDAHDLSVGYANTTADARRIAAGYEMRRDPITGRLRMMDAAESVKLDRMEDPREIAHEFAAYRAERSNVVFQDQRQLALTGFQLSAQTQAANLSIANEPLAAQTIQAVAAARIAVANADPRLRGQMIQAETAQLMAIEHSQFGFRSGATSHAYSSLDEALSATGFGMDLGGNARDRRAAQGIIGGGIGQLGNPIAGTDVPQSLGNAATRLENAAGMIVKAVTGLTMFTPGS